jgi:signal transduction histidine kinase/CheY-like chemotaxis protein
MVFTFDDVTDHMRLQRSLTETAETLERRVSERTAELIEVNRQLVDAKNEAETANRSKTSFLAAASHDLLQPLNAARLFVSAMDGQALPDRPRALVQQTSTALDSVEDLLEALFEISRLDAGAIQPEIVDLPLGSIFNTLRVEFAPLAAAGGLQFDVADTGVWVRSDARLLRRVLQNFVSNAIRYTEVGQVAVEVEQLAGSVRVTVRDTGPGIAPGDRDEIFEEFRRVGRTQKIPGKGLGLAIVRRVSTMLGHEIALQSTPGQGSAFSISLPSVAPVVSAVREDPAATVSSSTGGMVLVIDNDPAILSGMEALLENWGLEVVTARDPGDVVVTVALAQGLAMLIVDYQLDDGLMGDTAIAMIRKMAGREIPAMVITADRAEEAKTLLASLALPVLHKPVKPAQLRALLRQMDVI